MMNSKISHTRKKVYEHPFEIRTSSVNPVLTPSDFNRLLAELKRHVTKPEERPLSVKEAMDHLGVRSRNTIYVYVKRGLLKVHRINGRPVFFASEINDAIKKR